MVVKEELKLPRKYLGLGIRTWKFVACVLPYQSTHESRYPEIPVAAPPHMNKLYKFWSASPYISKQGWDEGVPQLSLGEDAILRCTSDYAYGPAGAGGVIPPNAGV